MEKSFNEKKDEMKMLLMCLENEPINQRIEICKIIDESNTIEQFSEKSINFIDKISQQN